MFHSNKEVNTTELINVGFNAAKREGLKHAVRQKPQCLCDGNHVPQSLGRSGQKGWTVVNAAAMVALKHQFGENVLSQQIEVTEESQKFTFNKSKQEN